MPGPLVSADYVALIGDRTLDATDTAKVNSLIPIASNLVRMKLKYDVSSTTAPEAARLAVARLVLSVIDNGDDNENNMRAEQIGDYRIEYQRVAAVQIMDISLVDDLLNPISRRSFALSANVPQEGAAGEFDETVDFYTTDRGHRGYTL